VNRTEVPAPRRRWEALDDLRGLAVLVMIPVNIAAPYAAIPGWFKHAPGSGLTLADLVVPLFLFSLGVSAGLSWKKRVAERGYGRTFLHALLRNALLCAFGVAGMMLADPGARWEVLTMLGTTGMFSFFFLGLLPWPRIGAAFLVLAVVELLRPMGLGDLMGGWYDTGLAGPWGTFSLSFYAIVASALGELTMQIPTARRMRVLAGAGAVMATAGAAALLQAPFSKHSLSLSYVLFTAGASSALFALLEAWREALRLPIPVLGSLGRNPLLIYILHAILGLGVVALVPADTQGWIAWASALLVLAICVGTAALLDRRKLYIKL
jgi:predicted acyltransferase